MTRYSIKDRLGTGGMGTVHRALQLDLKREVAIKLLSVPDDELRQRFEREARVISQLAHPGIVRVFDWGELEGQLFYAMELIPGQDLSHAGQLPFPQALRLFEQAIDALAYLHERGLVHRDIKPSNFVLGPENRLVLIDFGLARDPGATALTQAGVVVGTVRYMPPELMTTGHVDAPGDVYALGLVVHELITGQCAVQGSSLEEMGAQILHGPRPSIAGRSDVPAWCATLHASMMAIDPAARPTAAAVRDALRHTRAHPVSAPSRKSRKHARSPRPRPTLAKAALTCALSLVLVAVLIARSTRSVEPPLGQVNPARIAAELAPQHFEAMRERLARTLAVMPTERVVLVDFDLEPPSRVRVEVGRWDDRAVLHESTVDGSPGFVQLTLDPLTADTDHFVRVCLEHGPVLLADYRFHTLALSHADAVRSSLDGIRREPLSAGVYSELFFTYPDARCTPLLIEILQNNRPEEISAFAKIAWTARALRHGGLAQALMAKLPRLTRIQDRSEVLLAAMAARVPEATRIGHAALISENPELGLETLTAAAERVGGAAVCEALARLQTKTPDPALGVSLARIDRASALVHGARWLDHPTDRLHPELGLRTLAALGSDEAVAVMARHAGDAAVADALASLGTPAARAALASALRAETLVQPLGVLLQAAQRLPDPAAAPVYRERAHHSDPAIRRAALAALIASGAAGQADLLAARSDPDPEVGALAEWGLRNPTGVDVRLPLSVQVPACVTYQRTGIVLTAGQSLELSAQGSWGIPGALVRPELSTPLGDTRTPLGICACVGPVRLRLDRRPTRLLAETDGELVLTPLRAPPTDDQLTRPHVEGAAGVRITP